MKKPHVAIVNYGVGNLFSVAQACTHVGLEPVLTSDPAEVLAADAVVLPGVGAFGFAMSRLHSLNLVPALMETVQRNRPLVGVCLGFQLLFEASEEMGSTKGLGLVPGIVKPLANLVVDTEHRTRVPNIAWLPITPPQTSNSQNGWQTGLLSNLAAGANMYFVHSYYAEPTLESAVRAVAKYHGHTYCCATERENIFGCQFHPEKSAEDGLQIYRNLALKIRK